MSIKISQAEEICKLLGMTRLIIYGVDEEGKHHCATYGKSDLESHNASQIGNILKRTMGWKMELCNSVPAKKECLNCNHGCLCGPVTVNCNLYGQQYGFEHTCDQFEYKKDM